MCKANLILKFCFCSTVALMLFSCKDPVNKAALNLKGVNASEVLKDSFWVDCPDVSTLPAEFRNGYILLNDRSIPGSIALFDTKGNLVWSAVAKDEGFKVVRYTQNKSLLCITGTKDYEVGYGNGILEFQLNGDTLCNLKMGGGALTKPLHHDILLNSRNEIVILVQEEKILDLTRYGGSRQDTVYGDAIQVLDRKNRPIWKWSVFDVLDPLADSGIMKNKKDWMHANSIAIDDKNNFLVSFYNRGQVWNIDAVTGKVLWKFGRNGDFKIPGHLYFDNAHSIHLNKHGDLMLFDNGTSIGVSRTLAYTFPNGLDEVKATLNVRIPPPLFTDRMGSSYLIGDSSLLVCASKHKLVMLTNLNGKVLWQLHNKRFVSYRATFIPGSML